MHSIHRPTRHRNSKFVNSPKCISAIPASTALHRDLLIQSALDAHVRSIEFVDEIRHRGRAASPRSIILNRDDGRFMLDILGADEATDAEHDEDPLETLQSRGISLLKISPEQIRRGPRFGNARRIWEFCNADPGVRQRERILDRLWDRGPQTIYELELFSNSYDVVPSLSALACADLVEIDIDSSPLGPRTLIRTRR